MNADTLIAAGEKLFIAISFAMFATLHFASNIRRMKQIAAAAQALVAHSSAQHLFKNQFRKKQQGNEKIAKKLGLKGGVS